MNLKTREIILYVAGLFLLISGILGTLVPQLGLSIFTSVVWAVLGAVFLAIAYGTKVRKIVFYAAGIFLFVAGIVGLVYTNARYLNFKFNIMVTFRCFIHVR